MVDRTHPVLTSFPDPNEAPLLELSVSCDNLLCDALGRAPSARVVLSVGDSSGLRWARLAQTEVAEKSSNPVYLRTIAVRFVISSETARGLGEMVVHRLRE